MNILSITSQGSGIALGPVTLKKLWPYKAGDKSMNGVFTDASGESPFKMWGVTPSSGIYEGCVVTLTASGPKGGINNKEYPPQSGKWALNVSDCRIEIQGAGQQEAQQPVQHVQAAPVEQYAPPARRLPDDKLEAVAARAARGISLYIDELVVNQGFTRDEALMLAQGAHAMFPLWWFGEKGV